MVEFHGEPFKAFSSNREAYVNVNGVRYDVLPKTLVKFKDCSNSEEYAEAIEYFAFLVLIKREILNDGYFQIAKKCSQERRIFRYIRSDGWNTMSQVDVIEGVEKDNVRCLYFETPGMHANTRVESSMITASQSDIDRIRDIMLTHLDVCKYEKIEIPVVLDGVINTFEFAPEKGVSNTVTVFNISAFRKGVDVAIEGNPPYKGREVLKLYDEISKILLDDGVDQKYIGLDLPCGEAYSVSETTPSLPR